MKKILIAEISGKRPGGKSKRPTEKFNWDFDKVIISNNSDGYDTDWPIVDVPHEYVEWYKQHAKQSDNAWYAPMNRSYAIQYAIKNGYDYLVQLDDNINNFEISYSLNEDYTIKYRTNQNTKNRKAMQNDMVRYFATVLDETNAGIVGCRVIGASLPGKNFLNERYVYSFFMMNLKYTTNYFQGDFEDDIEYRLKMRQKQIPIVCVSPFAYSKTAQNSGKKIEDLSGNRKAYAQAGVNRGKNMSRLYGHMYQAGLSTRGSGTHRREQYGKRFRHKLTPFKVGVRVHDINVLKSEMAKLLTKYATPRKDVLKIT